MNLIERYIQHVGKHLPEKSREDVKREIRSLIEDSLEDRSRELERPVDEAMTVDVLKEFGRPEKMAASYTPERYLIGPRMFPIFALVVKIVMSVLFALMLVKLFINLGQPDANLLRLLPQSLLEFAGGAIAALGNIVLVFAVLQYFMPELSLQTEDEEKDWDPLQMEKIEDDDQINRIEMVFGITFSVIGLAWFNFYTELLGFSFVSDGEWILLPALSAAFFTYLPWINIIFGAEILLNLFLLIRGQWQNATRWISMVVKAATIILAGFMLAGPSLVDLNPQDMVASGHGFTLEAAETLVSMLHLGIKGLLVLVISIDGFEIARRIYKLLSRAD
jgi:hypothetical protein